VAGISFAADGQAVFTGPRQPLDDLDRLPMPAWDLLPMDRYGRASRNHPHLAAVELGRGCPWACDFCVLWRQMGRFLDGRPAPLLRTKSAARVLEEVRTLARRYGRRYLGWVDPCFNADPDVPGQVAELLLRDGLRLGQSAWVRADGLLRDESSGALPQCVQAGLNEVYLGIERPDADGLRYLNKSHNGGEVRRAVRMLQEKHPEVFTVGSMIFGLPGDTPATIRGLYRFAHELDLDMVFYIPLTPLPGTPYWRPELWDPTGRFFRSCDFLPGVQGDPLIAELSRTLCWCFLLRWPWARLRWGLRGLTARDARRRSIIRRHSVRGLAFAFRAIAGGLLHRENADNMRYPAWYDT